MQAEQTGLQHLFGAAISLVPHQRAGAGGGRLGRRAPQGLLGVPDGLDRAHNPR